MGNHLAWVIAICIASDVLLLSFGVFGVGSMLAKSEFWSIVLAVLGIVFLCSYGFLALKNAFLAQSYLKVTEDAHKPTLHVVILQTLAVTYLNPGTYVDIVVLLGGIASQLSLQERYTFFAGSICASCIWFLSIGLGSKILRPFFANKKAWQILDLLVAIVMFSVAFGLLRFILNKY